MASVFIRPYRAEDRAAVRQISFDTALMGRSIESQYRDVESLADMLTAHYTDNEPENALVAVENGEVVGYLLSCRDARRVTKPGTYGFKHIFTRGVCFRPGTAGFYFMSLRDVMVDVFSRGAPKLDYDRYPCHTHSNFKPGYRGAGVGTKMFYRLFDHYKRQGVYGMHAQVLASNRKTLAWAQAKLGYRLHGEPYYVPGLRDEHGQRLMIQTILRELENWELEAWQKPGFELRAAV